MGRDLCAFLHNVLCKPSVVAFEGIETADVIIVYLFPIEIRSYFLSKYGSRQVGNHLLFQYHGHLSYMNRIDLVERCSETAVLQLETKLNLSVTSKVTAISVLQGSLKPCYAFHKQFGIMDANETKRYAFLLA